MKKFAFTLVPEGREFTSDQLQWLEGKFSEFMTEVCDKLRCGYFDDIRKGHA